MTSVSAGRCRDGAVAAPVALRVGTAVLERSPDGDRKLSQDTRERRGAGRAASHTGSAIPFRAMEEPAHLALHPFGQPSTGEEGDLACAPARVETGCTVSASSRGFPAARSTEAMPGRGLVRPAICLEASPGEHAGPGPPLIGRQRP